MVFLKCGLPIFFIAITFSGCSRLFYFPDRYLHFPPEKNGYQKEDVHFDSYDNTKLLGWFFPATTKPVRGTIVQFHGNAENISSHYASLVWLTSHGYNLFSFDYRGYGGSDGTPNQHGTYLDGLAGIEKGWELHLKSVNNQLEGKQFIVYGQSLGGAIASRAFVDSPYKHRVSLLVLDSTFPSYQQVAAQFLGSFGPLANIVISDAYAPEPHLHKLSSHRVLVIHDRRDGIVNIRHGIRLRYLIGEKAEFWENNEGRHIGVFAMDTLRNRQKFLDFLKKL